MEHNFFTNQKLATDIFESSRSISVCINRKNRKWKVRHITKNIEGYGYRQEDFMSGKICWDDIIHPEDLGRLRKICADYMSQGKDSYYIFYRIVTAGGEAVWVFDYSSVNWCEKGRELYTNCIISNYSKISAYLSKMEDHVKQQSVLTDILQALYAGNIEHSFHTILDRTGRYLNFSRAMILRDNESRTEGAAIYEWHKEGMTPVIPQGFTISYDDIAHVSKQLDETGKYIVTTKADGKELILSFIFAIHNAGRRYGALILDKNESHRIWDEEVVDFLERIAELVSITLTHKEHQEALRASQEHVRRMAYLDYLTQLPNRYHFEKVMGQAIIEAERGGGHGYVLFIDIDDFKIINDGYGHGVGDKLLILFARFLKEGFGELHEVFRFGGDEFILLVKPERAGEIRGCIDGIAERMHFPWQVEQHSFYCTASIGVVRYPDYGKNTEDILRNADVAMYQGKLQGKRCYVIYSDRIANDSIERVEMEHGLRNAIGNNFSGFEAYYQPIVHAKTERIKGAEALIRWQGDNGKFISPGQFIPLAEQLGLIVPIGEYMLREAAMFCKKMNENDRPDFSVSVNVSVRQLQQQDFVQRVFEVLAEVGVNYGNIVLEITEGLAVTDIQWSNLIFAKLREKGIKIAIDDFGTGYSSLNYMREMLVDIIKIDRAFVRDITDDAFSQSFVRLITELGHTMGKTVCVEGVETEDQLAHCIEANTDLVQGHFYYKAIPTDDVIVIFKKRQYIERRQATQPDSLQSIGCRDRNAKGAL